MIQATKDVEVPRQTFASWSTVLAFKKKWKAIPMYLRNWIKL